MAAPVEHERSIADLLRELGDGTRELIRQEVRLARAEVRENVDQAKRGAVWLGIAAAAGLMTLVLVPMGLTFALEAWMPRWAAALLLAAIFGLTALLLAYVGRRKLRSATKPLAEAADSVQRDVTWAKEEVKQQLS